MITPTRWIDAFGQAGGRNRLTRCRQSQLRRTIESPRIAQLRAGQFWIRCATDRHRISQALQSHPFPGRLAAQRDPVQLVGDRRARRERAHAGDDDRVVVSHWVIAAALLEALTSRGSACSGARCAIGISSLTTWASTAASSSPASRSRHRLADTERVAPDAVDAGDDGHEGAPVFGPAGTRPLTAASWSLCTK